MKIKMNHKDVIIDIYDLIKLLKSNSDGRENAILHLQEYLLGIGENVEDYPCDILNDF
jgi:hypothetical protein